MVPMVSDIYIYIYIYIYIVDSLMGIDLILAAPQMATYISALDLHSEGIKNCL